MSHVPLCLVLCLCLIWYPPCPFHNLIPAFHCDVIYHFALPSLPPAVHGFSHLPTRSHSPVSCYESMCAFVLVTIGTGEPAVSGCSWSWRCGTLWLTGCPEGMMLARGPGEEVIVGQEERALWWETARCSKDHINKFQFLGYNFGSHIGGGSFCSITIDRTKVVGSFILIHILSHVQK